MTASAGATRPRMLVIVNPRATTVSGQLERLVVHALESRFAVEAVATRARSHATELARDAADRGFDVVVAFGGDGTVNETANGLIGSQTALACLPGGSTNVFARLLGTPRDLIDATQRLLDIAGRIEPERIDTASVNDRHYLFAAGVGLDASMVARVERRPRGKAWLRQHYFAYAAVSSFLGEYLREPPRLRVDAAGRSVEGITAIAQNADPLTFFGARPVRLARGAGFQTGSLAVSVLERAGPLDLVTLGARMLRAGGDTHPHVVVLGDVERALVTALDRPLPLEVDGEHVGQVDAVECRTRPRSLAVLR